MPVEFETLVCTREMFRPYRIDGLRWWAADEWEAAYKAYEGVWPDSTPWSRADWDELYSQGYRYCSVLRNGKAVASAGLLPRTNEEWEVIAVGTAPEFRNQGYGKAIVSFVTETILESGRDATIGFRESNTPMRRTAVALGYEVR